MDRGIPLVARVVRDYGIDKNLERCYMTSISNSILDGFIQVNNEEDLRVRQIHLYIEGRG
jgi:hypothetical protein